MVVCDCCGGRDSVAKCALNLGQVNLGSDDELPFVPELCLECRTRLIHKLSEAFKTLCQQQEPDEDRCEVCGEDVGLSSHYHCDNCGKVCSSMGHYDPVTSKYTCAAKPCPHESLRICEATSFIDAAQKSYRYLCTECGQEVLVPMRPVDDLRTDDFEGLITR